MHAGLSVGVLVGADDVAAVVRLLGAALHASKAHGAWSQRKKSRQARSHGCTQASLGLTSAANPILALLVLHSGTTTGARAGGGERALGRSLGRLVAWR